MKPYRLFLSQHGWPVMAVVSALSMALAAPANAAPDISERYSAKPPTSGKSVKGKSYRDDDDYDDDRYEDRDDDRYEGYRGNQRGQLLSCSSNSYNYRTCNVGGNIDRVYVERRTSDASCRLGSDWGYSRSFIWVDNGCAARFNISFGNARGRTGYEPRRYDDPYYRDDPHYRDDPYYGGGRGYGDGRGRDPGYYADRRVAINQCIARAERRLSRDGFRRFFVERSDAWAGHRGINVSLEYRVRHGNHFHYPVIQCRSDGYDTWLTRYDFGDRGRQCGFAFRL